jgi:hypothetical protein
MSIRGQGKAGFAHIQQNGRKLQLYVRLDNVGGEYFITELSSGASAKTYTFSVPRSVRSLLAKGGDSDVTLAVK